MILEPKDALVCMLEDDVPDLVGIAGAGVEESRVGGGHVKGVVGHGKHAPKIPRSKDPQRARDTAYPCRPLLVKTKRGLRLQLNILLSSYGQSVLYKFYFVAHLSVCE